MNTLYLAEKVCLLWSKPGVTCKLAVLGWPPALWIYGFNLWTSFHKVLLSPHTFLTLAPLPGSSAPVMTASSPPVAPSALEAAEILIKLTLPLRELWITCPVTEKGGQKQWQRSIPSRSWNRRVSRTKAYPIFILINYKGLTLADF